MNNQNHNDTENKQKTDKLTNESLKIQDVEFFSKEMPALNAPLTDQQEQTPILEIIDLSVKVLGRTLLNSSSADINHGEIALLVGGSGAGKSVLVKILLGLITTQTPGFDISGEIKINGRDILKHYPEDLHSNLGVVFQDYALFDEFSPKQNIKFAYAHSPIKRNFTEQRDHMRILQETLSLNLSTPIVRMSGGERRRLAIARTLAFDPEIILYDEPTTGLDPLNSERVAQLIGRLSSVYQKTALVVTHDYEHLRAVANKVILIDPKNKQLLKLNPADAEVHFVKELLKLGEQVKHKKISLFRKFLFSVGKIFENTSKAFEQLIMLPVFPILWFLALLESTILRPMRNFTRVIIFKPIILLLGLVVICGWLFFFLHFLVTKTWGPPLIFDILVGKHLLLSIIVSVFILCMLLSSKILPSWVSFKWGIRFFFHYLKLSSLSTSLIYIGLAGFIGGFVTTYFLYEYFPYRSYTEPLMRDDILRALGFLNFRVIIPLLVTILVAARSGAAIAADVGNRIYTHQSDALKTFGLSPKMYWTTNIFGGFLIGGPILLAVAYILSSLASGFAFLLTHSDQQTVSTLGYWWEKFTYEFREPGQLLPIGFWWMMSKCLVCFSGIALISSGFGMSKKESSVSVSKGITQTIWWATLFVLLTHMIFAFFEFTSAS